MVDAFPELLTYSISPGENTAPILRLRLLGTAEGGMHVVV